MVVLLLTIWGERGKTKGRGVREVMGRLVKGDWGMKWGEKNDGNALEEEEEEEEEDGEVEE